MTVRDPVHAYVSGNIGLGSAPADVFAGISYLVVEIVDASAKLHEASLAIERFRCARDLAGMSRMHERTVQLSCQLHLLNESLTRVLAFHLRQRKGSA